MTEQLHADLLKSILDADMVWARQTLRTGVEKLGPARVLGELVEPVLAHIGELWADEAAGISLAQGYLAAKVAEEALAQGLPPGGHDGAARHRPVVIGNIEDDFHSLGRKMVGAFLRSAGWEVHDLGNDVPAEVFVARALAVGAKVVGASAMTFTNAHNIRRLREAIDHQGLTGTLQLAVGGAVFLLRPELVEAAGGDGTAKNAVVAPQLFDRLWNAALAAAGETAAPREHTP